MHTLGGDQHGQQILAAWIGKDKLRDVLTGHEVFLLAVVNRDRVIFIGLACLALGVYGAGWRVLHGYRLSHDPRRR